MNLTKLVHNKLAAAVGLAIAASTVAGSSQAALQIEEVLVTAQKRSESSQDIPVAITAVSSETLENMGVQSFTDLTKVSSSLTISESNNKNESPISLRGIGTYSFSIGTEPSVLVVIDDMPVARSGASFTNLVDIERVEVLRGPQSTLFGKNASAGVINIVTKAPSEELEGTLQLTTTNDEEYAAAGSISGKLSDSVGVRLGGYYNDRQGHIRNLTTGEDLNGSENYGGRLKLVADLSEDLTATFIGEYNESMDNCCAAPWRYIAPGTTLFGVPDTVFAAGLNPSEENREVKFDGPNQSDSTDWLTSLKLDYNLGEYTLTSITGYRDWQYDWALDVDLTDVITINQGGPYGTELFTQEFRVASPASETFEYVAGLYYADTQNTRGFMRGPTIALASWDGTADSETLSVFGQARWGLSEKWNLITGLRLQTEEVSASFLDNRDMRPCSIKCTGSDTDNVVTGKLALQYFATDDLMAFGGWSRGYKGQSYDITSSTTQESLDEPVAPEQSDAYELGIKSSLFDGRVQLNATAFYSKYADFQATSTVADQSGNLVFKLNNVGELETQGLEIDALAVLTENFRMNFGLAVIDATIKSFKGADCYPLQTAAQGCVTAGGVSTQDLSGKDLANSPDFKFTIGGDWRLPLKEMPFDGFVNFSYQWQDDVNFDLLQHPDTVQEAYGLFNLSAGIAARDEKESYRLTLFVNNLFDESYVGNIAASGFTSNEALTHQIPRGSEIYGGLKLKLNF